MMASFANENFDIPAGYTVEKIDGQLYLEDIGEDDELYLIRIPNDIELSELDKKKIILPENRGDVSVKNIRLEDGKLLECLTETRDIPNTCVVLPKRSDGQLHAVKKPLRGSILISEGLELENDVNVKTEVLEELPESFENTTQETRRNKTKSPSAAVNVKVKSEEKTDEQFMNLESSSQEPKKKKNKKKKHLPFDFETSDLNYETEDAEHLLSPDRIKEQSPEQLMNLEGSSQEPKKKKNKKKKHLPFDFETSDLNYETEDAEHLLPPDRIKEQSPKKHSKSSNNIAVSSQSEDCVENSHNSSLETKKKSKKKKKHSLPDFDVSTENNESENPESLLDSSLQKKHSKKHKHKKSSDQPKIKSEFSSMDWDDFPNCDSQK